MLSRCTVMPLADKTARNAKGRKTPYKLFDGGGLYLLVRSDGARYWRIDYRHAGKRRTLALGVYPSVTLAAAREQRDSAKRQLAAGIDPSARRKQERLQAKIGAGNTFRIVADEWVAKQEREGRAVPTLNKTRWLLSFTHSVIGDRPIAEIAAPELLGVLRKVEARGRSETARRLRSICGQVFRYAVATGRAQRDPASDLRGALTAPKVKHRAAVTDPASIGAMLRAIDGFEGQVTTVAALKLAAILF